jgi:ubiquinone/menaquinone biosynthesis C-methylase UbiE
MESARDFYESTYHFEADMASPGESRLWRSMRLLEPMGDTTFLDLGSGVGWAAKLARERGRAKHTVGIDFAFKALRLGAEQMPETHRVQGDGCHLPLQDRSIDRVLSFGSVEHFPDVVEGLRELARVLAPGGRAVVVVPNFYVRTEQPQELRQSWTAWKRDFDAAGLEVLKTRADFGPKILRDRRPARVVFRAGVKVLALIPGLQYQFVFLLRRRGDC